MYSFKYNGPEVLVLRNGKAIAFLEQDSTRYTVKSVIADDGTVIKNLHEIQHAVLTDAVKEAESLLKKSLRYLKRE